ncbi:hypothetical protein [Streptomyces sp. H27-C3]|uniref:hypothetical protein n=1 Tax=Streptomyces sp. H27-C3 TaxID=3046305 RepID=UPI0024B94DDD|nr:hypothetical protein [Streptomyces sp. H27-C3]MDJ0461564.1 hypothetical protein [Streptomyces sp. H27-C3]
MIADDVASELELLGVTSVSPGMSAVAIKLARALDAIESGDAPTSQAVVADKLTAIMTKLRGLAQPATEGDGVDDIAEQREKRRSEARKRAAGG